mmetsp:Transcript_4930/g.5699  ORF Transcript_4930/g.5699 Transcript_4930/m.5699 type:complete len:390 (+) Transcript_4930:363-1532(+)
MGAGPSTETSKQRRRTRALNQKIRDEAAKERSIVKLLLLGAGESGKSTLLKQMKVLYGQDKEEELSEFELKGQTAAIRANIVINMKALVENADFFIPEGQKNLKEEKEQLFQLDGTNQDGWKYDQNLCEALKALWDDELITTTWEKYRNLIQVQDALPWFMANIDRIFEPDYVPTKDDWLRVRVRSSGILEERFTVDGVNFNIWDVGGQRNERRKWIHCFDNVSAVIFVVAINEYDQRLYEDETVNRMEESLTLFRKYVNHDAFVRSGMILFLNKSDLYAEKLNRSPIRYIDKRPPEERRFDETRFADFKGPYCPNGASPNSEAFDKAYKAGISYFKTLFLNCYTRKEKKTIYHHVTCAMDQHNVYVVFNAVKVIILDQILISTGFARD